ncbi:MAG: hypothetical protein IJM96_02510 [Clostridia bacterium]|nr:hypothetical protein [Clostridia bacterium]
MSVLAHLKIARQVCQQALHYVDEHEKKLNAELPIRDTFAGLMSICELDMLEVAGNIGLIDVRNNLHILINDRFKQIRNPKSRDYYAIAQAFMACIDDYQKVSYEQWKDVFSNFSKVSYKIEDVSKLSEFEQGIEKYRYARALYTMGIAYKNGLGVEKNREKAKEYLEKSLEHGYDCSDIISIL